MTERSASDHDVRRRKLRALQKELGHEFDDLGLLDRALTHASLGNQGKPNYERFEFLGDAFLNFAVADALFARDPEVPVGDLTETRAGLVSRRPLAAIARQLQLMEHLEVGKGMCEQDRQSERILADLVEAVIGAIYLDGGVRAARAFVRHHVLARVAAEPDAEPAIDSKTALLHYCQRHRLGQPIYELVATSGLQHEQSFRVAARLTDGRHADGEGRNKRAAEKVAATRLLLRLRGERQAEA
jgi:ribonuclease III